MLVLVSITCLLGLHWTLKMVHSSRSELSTEVFCHLRIVKDRLRPLADEFSQEKAWSALNLSSGPQQKTVEFMRTAKVTHLGLDHKYLLFANCL